jgi:MFS family permease
MYPLLNKQLGFSEQQIATLSTIGGAVAALSSIVGGSLSDRFGRRRTLFIACLGVAAVDLAFMLSVSSWGSYSFQIGYGIVSAVITGIVSASTLALFMDLTHPKFAATQFQIYMALQNCRTSWSNRLGGWSAERTTAPRMFGLGVLVELLPLLLLPFLDVRKAKADTQDRQT